jgi:hypothetical protein
MNSKTIYWLLGGGLVIFLLFYFGFFDEESEEKAKDLPPAEPPPKPPGNTGGYGPQTGIGTGINPGNVPTYFIDEGPGKQAVNGRMRTIFNDRQQLKAIIRENGIANSYYNGLVYPDGMQQVMISAFGTRDGIPITPPTIDGGAFIEQMESLKALENINTLEAGGKLEFAKGVFRNAATLPSGETLWPSNLQTFLQNGFFGPGSRADKNGSNLWDRYGEDLKAMANNLVNAALDLDNVLRREAVEDLQGAGWNFVNA